jgi:hypothetical protein
MNLLKGYGFLGLLLAISVGLSVLQADPGNASAPDEKPRLNFSHKQHVQDAGIACADCHAKATESRLSTETLRPDHTNCQSCHEEQLNESCSTCHTGEPLEYVVPSHPDRELLFSHALHVEKGATCESCHAAVADMESVVGTHIPEMATCNTCHDAATAPNTCESCHTNLVSLRPVEHNTSDFVRFHKQSALATDANCNSCHTEESCQECHNGADLVSVSVPGSDLQVPSGPRAFALDRGAGQNKLKVHDLNFRFTHGTLAQSKMTDCQTCHDQQSFCSTCHMAGGNVNQAAFKPANHGEPGFVTVGVGTGGGIHALAAKRDIETCAACHDAQGADPTCVVCHTDFDGVRGNNPKTHERAFMRGVDGDWHTDPGANCYVCHTDPNARPGGVKGITFCGYCHS